MFLPSATGLPTRRIGYTQTKFSRFLNLQKLPFYIPTASFTLFGESANEAIAANQQCKYVRLVTVNFLTTLANVSNFVNRLCILTNTDYILFSRAKMCAELFAGCLPRISRRIVSNASNRVKLFNRQARFIGTIPSLFCIVFFNTF